MACCIEVSASVWYLFHRQAGTFFSKSSSISAADRLNVSSAGERTRSPLGLGDVEPGEDHHREGQGAIDESGSEIHLEEQGRGRVAVSVRVNSLGCNSPGRDAGDRVGKERDGAGLD